MIFKLRGYVDILEERGLWLSDFNGIINIDSTQGLNITTDVV